MLSTRARLGLSHISVVVPILNDRDHLQQLLSMLKPYKELELVIVDGGRLDHPAQVAANATLLKVPQCGRGAQIARGIAHSSREWIWILHADSVVDESSVEIIGQLTDNTQWGRFDVKLESSRWEFRVVETLMNLRSRITGICTGDQGMFVRREILTKIGGFPAQPLMEDVEVSKRLRIHARPFCSSARVGTSTRKWEEQGLFRTVFRMWSYRFRYYLGTSSELLYQEYYGKP